jgi:hypothetical protein
MDLKKMHRNGFHSHIAKNSPMFFAQGCGSGFNDFLDPDPESGSMGKKNEEKNALFLNF